MKPAAWSTTHTHLELFHGCLLFAARRIAVGVNPTVGNPSTDFGRGFYTTTRLDQAEQWARRVYRKTYPLKNPSDPPTIVKFVVPLDLLASLNSLSFVRGDSSNAAFWSFVAHCRASGKVVRSHLHPDKRRAPPNDWYDMIVGPVASWPPKRGHQYVLGSRNGMNFATYDQFSFHTNAAAKILNNPQLIPLKP